MSPTGARGVLFDAGGVLIRPVGGRWNPRHDFESIVLAHHPGVPQELFPRSFAEGKRVLDEGIATTSRERYHRAMLAVLGVADPSPRLLHELAAPPAGPVVELYPDVVPVLDELRGRGIRMSVVSDTWRGLDDMLAELGIGHYFDGVVISEVLGVRKPHPRMYAEGSRLVGLDPAHCLFVDDDPALVAAAVHLGYQGVALLRDAPPAAGAIASLAELPPLVTA